jgi:hypothetical protein
MLDTTRDQELTTGSQSAEDTRTSSDRVDIVQTLRQIVSVKE